ncbi:MAG: DUF2163 domain-containing protein [Rhodobacteraceae bacterium]|nr:DUF2163 domain-containing protein [Paracoccaceae bacterium]
MRDIPENFQTMLDTGATTVCRCWLLKRRDGVSYGFTDHDRDISFDGQVFQAGSGMDASALESSTGLAVDNGQAVGALSAIGLTDADILAGKYDRAEVQQWLVDWRNPASHVQLFRGFLGEIRRGSSAFEVELRSMAELLNQPMGRGYVPTCDRILGDSKCGHDLELDGVFAVDVVELDDARRIVFAAVTGKESGWFSSGYVRWLSGENAGVTSLIKVDNARLDQREIELWEEVRGQVNIGDSAELIVGCDKRVETCVAKFDNFLNFRGFPHIPGEDWVSDFPRQDGQNTGGSLNNG